MVRVSRKCSRSGNTRNQPSHNARYSSTEHKRALERQSGSKLMNLPREIRNKIWEEVHTNNIIHVSAKKQRPTRVRHGRQASTFLFHICSSPQGLASSACTKHVDHEDCITDGPSTLSNTLRICKAIAQEIPNMKDTFFSCNALQFEDILTAEKYLFGLREEHRASIAHLRLDLPFPGTNTGPQARYMHIGGRFDNTHYNSDDLKEYKYLQAWNAICNYFSCPWDRKTLHMGPDDQYAMTHLKEQVYFYYSNCYYQNNSHRLGHRWQVGLGNTSWDVGIADLKSKPEPRLDLAFGSTQDFTSFALASDLRIIHQVISANNLTEPQGTMPLWLRALCQFRQYNGLNVQFYQRDKAGVELGETVSTNLTEQLSEALKERLSGPVIGPQKCVFFLGHGGY